MVLILLIPFLAVSLTRGDTCNSEYNCASCTEVRICNYTTSGYQELFRFSCPSTAPYCNASGVCSPQPPPGCGPTDTFPCMQDGVFPSPSTCQEYHVCQNSISYTYTCPTYYYFNFEQGGCVPYYKSNCYSFNCYGKTGVKVAYTDDSTLPGFYAYCRDGIAVLVDRCPGSFKLNENTQTCGPECKAVGNKIPDPDDCTKYFYCTKDPYASDFTVTNIQCPDFYGFDPNGLRCVPLKVLPTCVPVQHF